VTNQIARKAASLDLLHTRATVPGAPAGTIPAPQLTVDIDIFERFHGLFAEKLIRTPEGAVLDTITTISPPSYFSSSCSLPLSFLSLSS